MNQVTHGLFDRWGRGPTEPLTTRRRRRAPTLGALTPEDPAFDHDLDRSMWPAVQTNHTFRSGTPSTTEYPFGARSIPRHATSRITTSFVQGSSQRGLAFADFPSLGWRPARLFIDRCSSQMPLSSFCSATQPTGTPASFETHDDVGVSAKAEASTDTQRRPSPSPASRPTQRRSAMLPCPKASTTEHPNAASGDGHPRINKPLEAATCDHPGRDLS